jgi:hypothetical protein
MPEPAGAHRGIQLGDRWTEVLRRRPELNHTDTFRGERLRHMRRLPQVKGGTYDPKALAQVADVALDGIEIRLVASA